MKRYCMVIDVEKCENCNNCFLSCKDEHHGNDWPGYTLGQPLHGHRWMNILRKEQGEFPVVSVAYKPKPCFHCEDAPCMKKVERGEIHKREDGIVLIDPSKSKGKKELVSACPHGAIWWNEDNQLAQKCTFCAHLLDDGWKAPRCVQACPTGALKFHRLEEDEFEEFVRANRLENFDKTQSVSTDCVLYKNGHLFDKCFVAGTVATKKDKVEDCVKGAEVELIKDETMISNAITDAYGDFKFDDLEKNSGEYQIQISYDEQQCMRVDVRLGSSTFVGTLWV